MSLAFTFLHAKSTNNCFTFTLPFLHSFSRQTKPKSVNYRTLHWCTYLCKMNLGAFLVHGKGIFCLPLHCSLIEFRTFARQAFDSKEGALYEFASPLIAAQRENPFTLHTFARVYRSLISIATVSLCDCHMWPEYVRSGQRKYR